MADAQHAGDSDDKAGKRSSEHGAHLHLPERRNASPWSKGILLVALVALVLSVPLWIDPGPLAELRGAGPTPLPSPSPTVTVTEVHE